MPKILTNRRAQVLAGALIISLCVVTGGSIGFASVVKDSSDAANSFLRSSISSRMYAADGSLLANLHGEIDRDPVPLKKIPASLRNAVIAIEDRRFFDHGGIDPRGIARAFLNDLHSSDRQGGSTISQQLAKNLYFHGQPRTLWRKAAEAVLAMGLEGVSSKDKILDAYLNTVYFGRGTYGVQAASRSYFHKDVSKLTLPESAFLAGLIHMPANYDWTASDGSDVQKQRFADARKRRNVVLDAMADVHDISRTIAHRAANAPLVVQPPKDPRWKSPYFVDAVLRELGVLRSNGALKPDGRFDFIGTTHSERAAAVYRKGLRIYTTLQPSTQRNAENAVREILPDSELPRLSTALVSVEPGTGFVRALVGGRDYYPDGCDGPVADTRPMCRHAKVNLALGSLSGGTGRQPGSSFKPIVLAAALEDGMSLRQEFNGTPFTYTFDHGNKWKVGNYEGEEGGQMSIVDATVHSVNAAYGRVEIQYLGKGDGQKGASKIATMARKLGITLPTASQLKKSCGDNYLKTGGCTPADDAPSIALGAKEVSPLQMAGAYATFANEGVYAKPTLITKITDATGKVLYTSKPQTHRAMLRSTALGVSSVLKEVVERGTGTRAALPDRPAYGKTGTSQGWRDAWFDGYVPQLATVVWVGNPIPVQDSYGNWAVESMTPANGYGLRVVGGTYPARIWNADMTPTTAGLEVKRYPPPPDKLFHDPEHLKGDNSDVASVDVGSGLRGLIELRRSGRNVVVHSQCPPGGSRGIHNWKTEQRPDGTVDVYRSRAVCH